MGEWIIGNLCSLLGMAADAVSSSRKTAKGVLLVQCVGQLCYAISSVALKGYSAAVQNAVSILRNLAAVRGTRSKALEWLLVALGVGLGILFNNRGIMGWLPIIANLEYSLAVFRFQDDQRKLKAAFLVCIALYGIFNAVILNFVGMASNLAVFVMTAVFLVREIRTARR